MPIQQEQNAVLGTSSPDADDPLTPVSFYPSPSALGRPGEVGEVAVIAGTDDPLLPSTVRPAPTVRELVMVAGPIGYEGGCGRMLAPSSSFGATAVVSQRWFLPIRCVN